MQLEEIKCSVCPKNKKWNTEKPKADGYYLCTFTFEGVNCEAVNIFYYAEGLGWCHTQTFAEEGRKVPNDTIIKAWMDIPKPYKEGDQNDGGTD